MRSAGIAKMVLLLEVARRIESGDLTAAETRSRTSIPKMGTLGLWQHFESSRLPINDIALLVASTGDNLATNVLMREIGVDPLTKLIKELGLDSITLTDHDRNVKDAGDVIALFDGSAQDWVLLLNALYHGRLLSAGCAMTLNWMSHCLDTSMVSDGFTTAALNGGKDAPAVSQSVRMTGSLRGACAEAGIITTSHRDIAYCVMANWEPSDEKQEPQVKAEVLEDMRRFGHKIHSVASVAPRVRETIPI
jgi:beta-lactamase class A